MGGILKFIQEHFMHVMPILVSGGIGLVLILERSLAIFWIYPLDGQRAFFERIRNYVMNERISEAVAFCEQFRGKPMANVVREGLLRAHQPESVIAHGLEVAVSEEQDRVQVRTSLLSMIANVATLLGLLGTIMGLIQSFDAVATAKAAERSALLTAGISVAMNATLLGLGVAIPCMIAFSLITNQSNRLNAEVERSAVKIMELIKQRYFEGLEGGSGGNRGNPKQVSAR